MIETIELNESKNLMKSMNVIIYGTIRDIEEHFIKSFTNIELLCNFFNSVYIIIFENDSIDNTRILLNTWVSHSNDNIIKHVILENNLNLRFPLRAHRLAYCRNQILNYIFENNLDNTYQYAIHCDLDDRFWSLDYDSICNCFQYDLNTWDAMFPINTNYTYYDYWALRCDQTWFNKNIFCCEIGNRDKVYQFENHISEFYTFLRNNKNSLISVNSAFNAIGIYKLKSLINCRYNASYYCNKCQGKNECCLEDNDHIGLHKNMKSNNCNLFINTKMFLENKNKDYISYENFVINLQSLNNIKKDPLKYVLYKKILDQNNLWLNFSTNLGIYENIISNFTKNNIITFCIYENYEYSNNFINKNVIKYTGNICKNINKFILNNIDSFISFIHIDFNNYYYTKMVFDNLYKKIKNGCIIIINKFINCDNYLLHDLHAFYEFTQKYNIKFEYIGINSNLSVNLVNNTSVAIKILENPQLSNIEITSDLYKYEDEYIYFDWTTYKKNNPDLLHIKFKEEAWDHWINHGKNEGRKIEFKKVIDNTKQIGNKYENEKNDFDWKIYIELNNDLSHVKHKEEAWEHWINYGKNEGRRYKKEIDNTKEIENDKNNFDWKKYIKKYEDLSNIKCKEDAWDHWINHGKNEGRKYYLKYRYDFRKNFDWKYYIENNPDLSNIKNEEDAWTHWINFGKNEGRNILDKNFIKFSNFDWKYYIENNEDLKYIKTKEDAWKHWMNYGKNENRLFKKKLKKVQYIFSL